MVHGEQLAGDELQVGDGAVGQHHQHLVRRQPTAHRAAPGRQERGERMVGPLRHHTNMQLECADAVSV